MALKSKIVDISHVFECQIFGSYVRDKVGGRSGSIKEDIDIIFPNENAKKMFINILHIVYNVEYIYKKSNTVHFLQNVLLKVSSKINHRDSVLVDCYVDPMKTLNSCIDFSCNSIRMSKTSINTVLQYTMREVHEDCVNKRFCIKGYCNAEMQIFLSGSRQYVEICNVYIKRAMNMIEKKWRMYHNTRGFVICPHKHLLNTFIGTEKINLIREQLVDGHECPICYQPLKNTGLVFVSKCFHLFHLQCIRNWIGKDDCENVSCPLCRQDYYII